MTGFRIFDRIRIFFVLPVIILTAVTTPRPVDTDSAVFESQKLYVLEQALATGQGVTTDGKYLYTSGAVTALNLTLLGKIDLETMVFVDRAVNPLPEKCRKRGNNHIGGISYYKDRIYASVEGGDTVYACIVVFDAATLEPTGEIYDLPNEKYDDGVPWLAVDPATGYLYASKWSDAPSVNVYDINDGMKQINEIRPSGEEKIDRIQGGEFLNGILCLSQDNKDSGKIKKILALDPASGRLSVAAERDVNGENTEAEGMTFVTRGGEKRMLVSDYNKAAGVYMREYRVPAVKAK